MVTFAKDGSSTATKVEICGEMYNRFEAQLESDRLNPDSKIVDAHYIDMAKLIPTVDLQSLLIPLRSLKISR